MELQYYGANCLRLSTKKARIIIDDNLSNLGLKTVSKAEDISIVTDPTISQKESRININMPGEYEISGVVIHGVGADPYNKSENEKNNSVIYTIEADELKLVVVGHVNPNLTEGQIEQIGIADIAVVPVGNNEFTLNGTEALKLIKQLGAKIIIPTHYADKDIKYKIPQQPLAEAIQKLGMEAQETVTKYKPNKSILTDTAHLIVLERM